VDPFGNVQANHIHGGWPKLLDHGVNLKEEMACVVIAFASHDVAPNHLKTIIIINMDKFLASMRTTWMMPRDMEFS